MGVQFSRTIKKIFLDEGGDPSKFSSVHLIEDFDIEIERIDLRGAGIVNVPVEMMQFTKLGWLQLNQNIISQLPPSISSLQNLKTLRLFSNYLQELPPEIGELQNLSTLDVGKNKLKALCPEICKCTSLTELNLQWNEIKALPEEIGQLKQLKILNLYINRLSELPPSITELTELESLDLAHNRILNFSCAIGEFKNLTSLNLVGNGCKELPNELIKLSGLRKFDIRCNYLEELPDEMCNLPIRILQLRNNCLKKLPDNIGSMTELIDFRLESNFLKTLPPSIGDLPKLRILLAYENELESLPPSLGNITQLIELDLTQNQLKTLPEELSNLKCIESLFLSKNQFKEVPSCIGKMETVLQIDMVHNQLSSLPDNLWNNLANLGKLNFNLNSIEFIPKNFFLLKNLVFLELACNQLEEIPEEICELKQLNFLNVGYNRLRSLPNTLCQMNELKKLYVSFNDFGDFQWPDEFAKLDKLKEFVCAGTKQKSIPKFLYELPSISYLDLSGNFISEISSNIKNIENLSTLILSYNQIESLPPEITQLQLLAEIDLCNNKLKSLPEDLGKLELLSDLDFSGNELEEIPDLRNIATLLQLKVAHNNIEVPPRVDPHCWVSVEGNINARVKKGKYSTEFEPLFKTKLRSGVSKRLSRWIAEDAGSPQFLFAWAETRGRRPDQQDTICILKNVQGQNLHYLGLYDGHGGTVSPEVTSSVLHQIFIDRLNHLSLSSFDPEAIVPLFSEAFGTLQAELTKHSVNDGTAANVVFLTQTMIFCANAGDSRAILVRDGAAYPLSVDHKPESFEERKRIEEAGGFVTESKRVNGVLALSRALGDCDLAPAITYQPDVTVTEIVPEDKYIVMGCDGLWDMLTSEQVAELIKNVPTAAEAAVMLRDVAYVLGSTDNISVIVAEIRHN